MSDYRKTIGIFTSFRKTLELNQKLSPYLISRGSCISGCSNFQGRYHYQLITGLTKIADVGIKIELTICWNVKVV